jgi:hypothetical protein
MDRHHARGKVPDGKARKVDGGGGVKLGPMRRVFVLLLVAAGAWWLWPGAPGKAVVHPGEGAAESEVSSAPGRWTTVAGAATPAQTDDRVVIEGVVVERGSGAPVAGARVRVAGGDEETVTDAGGRFFLGAHRSTRGRLVAQWGGWFGRGPRIDCADPLSPQRIELRRAAMVRGKVIDGEGQPLAGAELHLHAPNLRLRLPVHQGEDLVDQRATSDAAGIFVLDGVPDGNYQIDAHAAGFGASKTMVRVDGEEVVADFILTKAARLYGRVFRPDGRAVDAPVLLFVSGRERGLTDAQGGFDLSDLQAGIFGFFAYDAQWGSASESVELEPGESRELTLRLEPGATVEGTVRRSDGRPAAGAEIVLGSSLHTRADADGRWRIAGLHAGGHTVLALDDGQPSASLEVTVEENQTRSGVDLTLAGGNRAIDGIIVDSAGQPIAYEEVQIHIDAALRSVRSGSDGRFHASGLPQGPAEVSVSDGWDTIVETVDDEREVRLELPRRLLLRGTVVGGEGGSFDVDVDDIHESTWRISMTKRAYTSGRSFELDGLTPGRYAVKVTGDDGSSGEVEVELAQAPVTDVMVRLDPPGEVSGRVTDQVGQPLAGITISGGARAATSGSDGRFRVALKAGETRLTFASDDENLQSAERDVDLQAGTQIDIGTIVLLPIEEEEPLK